MTVLRLSGAASPLASSPLCRGRQPASDHPIASVGAAACREQCGQAGEAPMTKTTIITALLTVFATEASAQPRTFLRELKRCLIYLSQERFSLQLDSRGKRPTAD